MAAGDMVIFDQAIENIGLQLYDMNTDAFKFGLVDATITPIKTLADPHWKGTGTTNLGANEVGTGGGYVGEIAIVNPSWSESGSVITWDFDDPAIIAQHASGATDIFWMVIYNDDDVNKRAIAAVDLDGALSLIAGSLTLSPNVSGIYTITN